MENNIGCSNEVESEDNGYETVYVITEEELVSSFNLENHENEIIIDGSYCVTGGHSFDCEGQNMHLKDKESNVDEKLMSVISEKDRNDDTVDSCENVIDQLINNVECNQIITRENENSFINESAVNRNRSILLDPDLRSVKDSEESMALIPDQNSFLVHDQKKTTDCLQTIPRENSVSECEPDVNLLLTDWQKLTCPYCMKKFSKLYHMKAHMVTVHKFSVCEAPFPCIYCNALCQQKNSLFEHYKIEHKYEKQTWLAVPKRSDVPFTCPICEKNICSLSRVKKHISAIHKLPKSEAPFLCLYCLVSFQQQHLLMSHYVAEHKLQYWSALDMTAIYSSDPKTCTVCKKTFTRASVMKKHMVRTHKSKAPFPCLYCKESFLEENLLLMHYEVKHQLLRSALDLAKINSDDSKTYVYPNCTKTFTEENLMKKHMVTEHKSQDSFLCLDCNESFQEENLLLMHFEVAHKLFQTAVDLEQSKFHFF